MVPTDYSITAYDAALVIADAAKRLVADKKDVNRDNMRDYIQTAKVKTLQGTVAFDANGDLVDRTISVFQIKKDAATPPTIWSTSTTISASPRSPDRCGKASGHCPRPCKTGTGIAWGRRKQNEQGAYTC